jgi:hypothetical protein
MTSRGCTNVASRHPRLRTCHATGPCFVFSNSIPKTLGFEQGTENIRGVRGSRELPPGEGQ